MERNREKLSSKRRKRKREEGKQAWCEVQMKSPCTLDTVVYKLWLTESSPEAVYLKQQGVVAV